MKRWFFTIAVIVGIMGSEAAVADCVDGVRKETPAEAGYFEKVQVALKEVLPAVPGGWTFTPVSYGTLGGLCKGTPIGAFSITVGATYTYRPAKEDAERMNAERQTIQGEIDAMEKLPPELAKERNDLTAKYSEKTRAARLAEQEGKKELARSLYDEREAFGRQANEVREKHLASVKLKTDELRKKQQTLFTGPQEVTVKVLANELYPEKLNPEYESEIVAGKMPGPRSPGLKVQGVRVLLKGPMPKREEIMSLVDKARMERAFL